MILITGSTGQSGRALVERLSAKGVAVRALVRSGTQAGALSSLPHVQVVTGDMTQPDTMAPALRGVDRAILISSSDPLMREVQVSFIDAARRAGVRHVVKLSGIMPALDAGFRFAKMHAEIERHLEQSGLAYTHLRAGEFMPAYFRQVPNIVDKASLMLPMAEGRIASVDVGDIADVAALTLTGAGHEGKTYRLTGPEANSMTEIAEKLSVAVGKTIRYVDVPPEDARRAQIAAGTPEYTADALFELFAERRAGKESQVFPDVEELLGRRATSFDVFATRCAAIFRGEAPAPNV